MASINIRIKDTLSGINVKLSKPKLQKFVTDIADETINVMRQQLGRGGGVSKPGEFPITKSGALTGSLQSTVLSARSAKAEATANHAVFLTKGTYKMAKRKMLKEAAKIAKNKIKVPTNLVLIRGGK
jgi:hypothetical protein